MDTRFWGPSGWQLYHLIAMSGKGLPLFKTMKDVLPCKYCRESTAKFVGEDPPSGNLSRWMYDFHNKVNNKLRIQCKDDPRIICPPDDPTFEEVTSHYTGLLCADPHSPPGLDFLFCVVHNYDKNPATEAYRTLFETLDDVYPYDGLRSIMKSYTKKHSIEKALESKQTLIAWWYPLAKRLCSATGFPLSSRRGTALLYGKYKSGCKRGKTCRNGKKVRNHSATYTFTHKRLV
jgi:hypothetical protein